MRLKGVLLISCIFILIIISSAIEANPDPSGAEVIEYRSERGVSASPNAYSAYAGNVSEVRLSGDTITQAWQGFYGNVSGTIVLQDAANNSLYDWSTGSPSGEVYATNGTVSWTNIQCFNMTTPGINANNSTICNETIVGGTTSLCGKNATELEEDFGIAWNDKDGLNETFNLSQGDDVHNEFFVGSLQFSAGECSFTRVFSDTGTSENDEFEEVLLWDPDNNSTIFVSLLEDNALGFDNTPKDFEMIVLENGHLSDTATTEYWFYLELE